MMTDKPLTPMRLFIILILIPLVLPIILAQLGYFLLGTFAISKLPFFHKKKKK